MTEAARPADPPPGLVIRPARPTDREPVLAFCRQTWDWGDYLPEVWDDWLASADGRLLVGELAGRPVAVGRAVLVAPGEAWLEGLRVAPAHRRSGIGRAMTVAELAAAAELGAQVVRFATRADAYAVHRIAADLGFRHVATATVVAAAALDEDGPAAEPLGLERLDEVLRRVLASPLYPESGGLTWQGWTCRSLTPAELRRRAGAGELVALPGEPSAVALARVADADLVVEYLDSFGEAAAVAELGWGLRRLAARRGCARAEVRAPAALAAVLARAGYGAIPELEVPFWILEWILEADWRAGSLRATGQRG